MAHALGVDMLIAAESAGAVCLVESGFRSREKPSSTRAVPSACPVMEAARYIVGLRNTQLICGITCELFDNPVTTSDGQTYEKDGIETYWSKGVFRSPLTNSILPDHSLRPAITVRQTIEKLLSAEIESGRAAALATSDLDQNAHRALEIEKILLQIKPQDVHVPGNTLLLKLYGLCENEHLRDFAAACGALNVAGAWSSRAQSPAATPFLVRMIAFSHANQEKLAFLSHEAMLALRSTDSEIQTQGFRVLTALVADRVIPGLEDQMFEVLSPVIINRTPLLEVPENLYKSALSFMVHLLMHKQGLLTQRLVAAGAPAVALHVLKTMPNDTVGTNLACCFFSLLGNLHDDTKKRLKEMPGLTKAIMDATSIRDCGNFALMALAVVIGPRCTSMRAVQFMSRFPNYTSRHPAALTLLFDATSTPSIDTQVFGERPSVVNIVDYICVHLLTILPCVRRCCKNADPKGLENGVQLLQNVCSVLENESSARLISPISKKLFLTPASWKSIFVLATEIVNHVTPSIDVDDDARVPWQGTCASALALTRQYLRLTTRAELANMMATTDVHQQEIVGACLDILSYGAIAVPVENPVQRCVVLDMMQNAIGVIECVCCGVEYEDIGHTNICERLIEVSFMFCEDTIAVQALGTLQTLICSARAPAQFWELRAISSTNSCFRQEIIDARGHFYLLEIITNDDCVKSRAVEIQVLTLLRDVFSAPSTTDNHVDDRFHELCISMTLRKIDTNIRSGVECCDVTLAICLETLANTLIVDRKTPKEGLDALKPWRVVLRHGKVMDAMMEIIAHVSVHPSRPSHVIEQALRVIVILVTRGFSLTAATGLPLIHEPRVAERLVTVANFEIFASLLRVDFPSPETECDDLWCRFEPRAYSVDAYCRQIVCAIALLVLQDEVGESHASVFIDSSIVGAMLALLQPGLEKDPREDARHITPSGETFIIHALQALVSFFPAFLNAEIAIALGRVILKDRSGTDIADSNDEYSTGAKRGRNSMTATTDAKKKQKS